MIVNVEPAWTISEAVAVMVMVLPKPNVPFKLLEDNEVIVGAVVSIMISFAPAILFSPVGKVVEVIMLPTSSLGAFVSTYELTVRSALFFPAPTV